MSAKKVGEDVDAQLARMLESQKIQTTAPRQYTAEEMRIREQILAQYSQVSSALPTFSWSKVGCSVMESRNFDFSKKLSCLLLESLGSHEHLKTKTTKGKVIKCIGTWRREAGDDNTMDGWIADCTFHLISLRASVVF